MNKTIAIVPLAAALLGAGVHVGAFTVIEKGAVIGEGAVIEAQAGISGHIKIADGVQVGPQAGVPQTLDGSVKYVIGAPAESMKDFGARVLLPKLLAKTRAEVKELKARLDAAHEAK